MNSMKYLVISAVNPCSLNNLEVSAQESLQAVLAEMSVCLGIVVDHHPCSHHNDIVNCLTNAANSDLFVIN